MTTMGSDSSVKAINRLFSIVYSLFLYYLVLIIQAGVTSVFYFAAPIVHFFGGSWENLNDAIYELHERVVLFLAVRLKGMELTFYGDFENVRDKKENVIVICNHQDEADYFFMACAMEKTGSLSRMRHVMKDSLIWVPFVGGFLVGHGSFFINRKSPNWKRFNDNCSRLVEGKIPTSILIYPEGTTWNNALEADGIFQKSNAQARSNNREPFKYVLTPKHKGFHRLMENLRPQLDAVYDLTFMYASSKGPNGRLPAPGVLDILNGRCPEVKLHLKRIDISEVPESEEGVRDFLFERFQIKNDLLESFFNSNLLPTKAFKAPCQSMRHQFQSVLLILAALFLGFSSYGLSILPKFLFVPLTIGYLYTFYYLKMTDN